MMNIKPLNRKETNKILEQLGNEYGLDAAGILIDNYTFFLSEKNKIYIIDNKIKELPLDNLKINSLGLYICELNRDRIRLSIEGSQIIGRNATKNMYEVDDATARLWLKGNDIECNIEFDGFVIVKCKSDFMGSGKYSGGKLFNYIPKIRRIMAVD